MPWGRHMCWPRGRQAHVLWGEGTYSWGGRHMCCGEDTCVVGGGTCVVGCRHMCRGGKAHVLWGGTCAVGETHVLWG